MSRRPIMIVEDDREEALRIEKALTGAGLNRRFIRCDGREALDYLFKGEDVRSPSDMPSLIILDLAMPGVHGLDVLERIKGSARTRRIPTLILTNSDQDQHLNTTYSMGANSFIIKGTDDLEEKLRNVVMYWFNTVTLPPP